MDREGFRNRLKQYKQAREENPGLKYYDFMEHLAEFKAQEWGEDSDEILTHMLNDNTYNYKQMYKDNPNFEIKEGHFKDTYKTVYHPTFSNESIYSGNKSEYNPRGTIGGRWIYDKIQERNEYRPSYSQVVNDDFDYATTLRYIENSSDTIDDYYKDIKERAQNIGNLSNYATLTTYYPFISRVPYTGHSQLTVTGLVPNHQGDAVIGTIGIDKGGHNEDYNLITNNCSDATRCGLEHTFDKKINPFLFTTPGDVQDFALDELNAIPGKKGDQYFNPKTGIYQTRRISDAEKKANRGKSTVYIPINKEQRDKLIDFIHKGDKEQKFADGGEVTGPPTYEDWYKDITQPTLNAFDDVNLKVSMEEAATDLHNTAMMLPGYAERWAEYQKSKPKEDPSIDQFVDNLWENENPNNIGYRNGKYYPHKSPEGGAMTIGPGFKLGSGSHRITEKQAKQGVTKYRLNKEAEYIGEQHLKAVNQFLNYGQNTNPADTVSPQIKMGLMDLRHQVGPLNTWHELRDAVLSGDLDKIKKESTVTWSNNGQTKVDKRRKKIRDEKYFYYE